MFWVCKRVLGTQLQEGLLPLLRGARLGAQGGGEPGKPPHSMPPPTSPSPTAPLTFLRGQGQIRRGERQETLVAHVPVQQARDLAMEAGPEVRVLEFGVHFKG